MLTMTIKLIEPQEDDPQDREFIQQVEKILLEYRNDLNPQTKQTTPNFDQIFAVEDQCHQLWDRYQNAGKYLESTLSDITLSKDLRSSYNEISNEIHNLATIVQNPLTVVQCDYNELLSNFDRDSEELTSKIAHFNTEIHKTLWNLGDLLTLTKLRRFYQGMIDLNQKTRDYLVQNKDLLGCELPEHLRSH